MFEFLTEAFSLGVGDGDIDWKGEQEFEPVEGTFCDIHPIHFFDTAENLGWIKHAR